MGRVIVVGGTLAGVAAAARLARVGHHVTLLDADPAYADRLRAQLGTHLSSRADASPTAHPDPPDAPPGGTIDFPGPWRDLLKKSGRPAAGALGEFGLELVPDPDGFPTDRGEQYRHLSATLGEPWAVRWRDMVDHYADVWLALRPLGLEAEPDAAAARRSAPLLQPRRTIEDAARDLGHPDLAARVRAVATDRRLEPARTPAWLLSRLAVERTFGRWRLVDARGVPQPAGRLVDVLERRLAEREVALRHAEVTAASGRRVTTAVGVLDADAVLDTRDPHVTWRGPRRFPPRTFLDELLARTPIRDGADPRLFRASASSAAGTEPWAQLLSGALAAYAAHEALTGDDIRPTRPGHG